MPIPVAPGCGYAALVAKTKYRDRKTAYNHSMHGICPIYIRPLPRSHFNQFTCLFPFAAQLFEIDLGSLIDGNLRLRWSNSEVDQFADL